VEYLFQNFDSILAYTFLAVYFISLVPILSGLWRIFEKANHSGIISFIPIWNLIVLLRVAKVSLWLALPLLIPVLNVLFLPFVFHSLSKCFGKSWGMTLGLTFLPIIFFPKLGFGKAEYQRVKKEEVILEEKEEEAQNTPL